MVPAHAHLEGDRDRDGAGGRFENAGGGDFVAHQGAAGHLADGDFLDRTAEIDVDDIGAAADGDAGGLGHGGGVAARQLDRGWAAVHLGHAQGGLVLAHHGPGGDHLGDDEAGAEFAGEAAERQVGDAGHRRQDDRRLQLRRNGIRNAHDLGKLVGEPMARNAFVGRFTPR